jgi:hypothetical protein
MLSKKEYWKFGLVITFLMSACVLEYFAGRIYKRDNEIFDSAKISGRLLEFSQSSGGERIRVNTSNLFYRFQTELDQRYNYKQFTDVAEIGDSVNKEPFSETLSLIKKSGQNYYFTFEKRKSK